MARKNKKASPQAVGGDMARKIWLAGVGAYGRAFSEAQESLAKVSDESSKLFEDLVERGEEIEETVETRGRELAKRIKAPDFSMEERIKEMRSRLKIGVLDEPEPGNTDHKSTSIRLDAIEDRLDKIEAALKSPSTSPRTKARAKKKTAKKKTPAKPPTG